MRKALEYLGIEIIEDNTKFGCNELDIIPSPSTRLVNKNYSKEFRGV